LNSEPVTRWLARPPMRGVSSCENCVPYCQPCLSVAGDTSTTQPALVAACGTTYSGAGVPHALVHAVWSSAMGARLCVHERA